MMNSRDIVEKLKRKNIFLLMFINMFLDHGVSLKIFTQNKAFNKDFNNLSKNKISLQYHKKRSEHWVVVEEKPQLQR